MPDDKMEAFQKKRAYYDGLKKEKAKAQEKARLKAEEQGEDIEKTAEPKPDMTNLHPGGDEVSRAIKRRLDGEEEEAPAGGIGKVGGLGAVESKGGEDAGEESDDEGDEKAGADKTPDAKNGDDEMEPEDNDEAE